MAAMADLTIINLDQLPSPISIYFLDMVSAIRITHGATGTIRDLTWKIMNMTPRQFDTIYLVCDTFINESIKEGERNARGNGKRYVLNSPAMKVPFDFTDFLRNGDNKSMLLNIMEQTLVEDKEQLRNRTVYFSNKSHCRMISSTFTNIIPELASDHEEADIKLVALVNHSAHIAPNQNVVVRSPSGDIGILVLFLMHSLENIRVYLDNGTGKSRKVIDMNSSGLSREY